MKIVYNNIIPFKGFMAINLFGIIFVRKEYKNIHDSSFKMMINHESIHTAQMKELLYIGFYIWYFIEWIIKLILCIIKGYRLKNGYNNISFENEAYDNQTNPNYLTYRKHYNWIKTINKLKNYL